MLNILTEFNELTQTFVKNGNNWSVRTHSAQKCFPLTRLVAMFSFLKNWWMWEAGDVDKYQLSASTCSFNKVRKTYGSSWSSFMVMMMMMMMMMIIMFWGREYRRNTWGFISSLDYYWSAVHLKPRLSLNRNASHFL